MSAKDGGEELKDGEAIMLEYYRFKEVHDLFCKGQEDEARRHLQELQGRYVALCDENSTLRTQIQGYEDILYLSRNLIFDGMVYWLVTGSIKQGPFCSVCYNRDGLLLRLMDEDGKRHCLTCGSEYDKTAPQPVRASLGGSCAVASHVVASEPPLRKTRKARVIPFGK